MAPAIAAINAWWEANQGPEDQASKQRAAAA
jgi:hypothetical protein